MSDPYGTYTRCPKCGQMAKDDLPHSCRSAPRESEKKKG